ncbi:hypothetical protein [Mycobacteroides abscessus]|uniref:hypothetical protein n=1 Tax=Mycobacteroides abscessus TaxID=36809 RepID=UPI00189692D4
MTTGEGEEWSPYVQCVSDLITAAQAAFRLDSTPSDTAISEAIDQLDCIGSEIDLLEPLQSHIDLAQRIIDAITNQLRTSAKSG